MALQCITILFILVIGTYYYNSYEQNIYIYIININPLFNKQLDEFKRIRKMVSCDSFWLTITTENRTIRTPL